MFEKIQVTTQIASFCKFHLKLALSLDFRVLLPIPFLTFKDIFSCSFRMGFQYGQLGVTTREGVASEHEPKPNLVISRALCFACWIYLPGFMLHMRPEAVAALPTTLSSLTRGLTSKNFRIRVYGH